MFKSKNEKSLWKMLFEYVTTKPIDTVFTFEEITDVIGEDVKKNRQPVYRARKELAKRFKTYLASESGVGYRLIQGMDMLNHAEKRMVRAEKQTQIANFESVNISTAGMTNEQKNEVRQFLAWNGMVISSLSHNAKQIADFQQTTSNMVNDKLNDLTTKLESYSQRMDEISAKL